MTFELSLGFSPCPNDTFIFHALVHGKVPLNNIQFRAPLLEDVETLNRWALAGKLDVSKLSFHALGHVQEEYSMLESGAALGRGCGPLLVARGRPAKDPADWCVAIPGTYTTAALLLKLFLPDLVHKKVMSFEKIMPAVASGQVDAGVIIHESRFTYKQHHLVCLQDLGEWWETETGLPIPLGCIAARRSLPDNILSEIDAAVHESLVRARQDPAMCLPYIKKHARELDETVIAGHVGLYVNDFSVRLGDEGRKAVAELFRRGRDVGAFPSASETT